MYAFPSAHTLPPLEVKKKLQTQIFTTTPRHIKQHSFNTFNTGRGGGVFDWELEQKKEIQPPFKV